MKRFALPKKMTDRDPTPAYFKLQMRIRQEIENGRWVPGQSISSERMLADQHQVSVGTVKKAILNLVNAGYLYRIQGKGTFVASRTFQVQSLRYYRFLSGFEDTEVELRVKRLALKRINGLRSVNPMLKLKSDQRLYELKRAFFWEKNPVVYSISYLPCRLFKDLTAFPIQKFEHVPLYLALEQSFGLPTIFNKELFSIQPADGPTAAILNIRKGRPVLMIEMLSFTYKQRPYEYRKSYCVTAARSLYRELL